MYHTREHQSSPYPSPFMLGQGKSEELQSPAEDCMTLGDGFFILLVGCCC